MSSETASAVVGAGSAWQSMIPMVAIFVIFYFFLIRPQLKRQKLVDQMINNLKKGDRVLAAGGLYGVIQKIDGNVIFLEIADNVRIKAAKTSVTEVINSDDSKPSQEKESKSEKSESPSADKEEAKKNSKKTAGAAAKKTKAK